MLSLGRIEEAIEQLQSAIPLARQVNSANVEGALTMNLGDGYFRLGMFDKAIDTYRRGVDAVRRLNMPRRTARSTTTLAGAHFENGDRAAAEETITAALDLYAKSGDQTGQAETRALYGHMLHANGDTDAPSRCSKRPFRFCTKHRIVCPKHGADHLGDRGHRSRRDRRRDAKTDDAIRISRLIASPGAEQRALYMRALALQQAVAARRSD